MQKVKSKICSVVLAIIFAFSPLLFCGCDISGLDDLDNNDGSDSDTSSSVDKYLSAINVAYRANVSSDSTNDEITKLKEENILSANLLAKDLLVSLCGEYGYGIDNQYDFSYVNSDGNKVEIEYDEKIPAMTQGATLVVEVSDGEGGTTPLTMKFAPSSYTQFENAIASSTNYWKIMKGVINGTIYSSSQKSNYINYICGGTNQVNVWKITYAVLSIISHFENITDNSQFSSIYQTFKTDYENEISKDATTLHTTLKKSCDNLAVSNSHVSIVKGSMEEDALSKFILDEVIGTDLINTENSNYSVFNGTEYVNATSSDRYEGEYYYYLPLETEKILVEEEWAGLGEYLLNSSNHSYEITNSVNGNKVKLFQDLPKTNEDGSVNYSGTVDIKYYDNENTIPKYRPKANFKNYKNVVSSYVNAILNDSNRIHVIDGVESGSDYITNYETISNTFNATISYKALEILGASDSEYACKLPSFAYKNIVFCAKKFENGNNNLGSMRIMFESAKNTSVDIILYARYYTTSKGYANWKNGESYTDLYPIDGGEKQTVSGPFTIAYNEKTQTFDEGCSFEIDVQEMLKNAYFGSEHTPNDEKFNYEYYSEVEAKNKTVEIYRIFPYPDISSDIKIAGWNNLTQKLIDFEPTTASAFKPSSSKNLKYKTISGPDVEILTTFDNSNITTDFGYGYLELLLSTSNNSYITFGLMNYFPTTETFM